MWVKLMLSMRIEYAIVYVGRQTITTKDKYRKTYSSFTSETNLQSDKGKIIAKNCSKSLSANSPIQ